MTDESVKPTGRVDDEASLLELLLILAKHKVLVLGFPMAAAVVAGAISFLLPDTYTATARVLPPHQSQSSTSALLGQLGNLAGLAPASIGVKSSSDLYVGMLRSRTVSDAIVEQYKLQELLELDTLDEARLVLAQRTRIASSRDGIISIEVDWNESQRSAALANAYVSQLEKLNERLAVTEAAQRRLFFEQQLAAEKKALAVAELDLKKTQEETGLIRLDEQGRAAIEAVAHLRAQIAAKEVYLGAMRSFATETNPDRVRAQAELVGLQQQLAKLELSATKAGQSMMLSTARVPEAGLEYVRKLRDVRYHEALLELLSKQYELARLDESRDASIIQVLDHAVPPERRSKPRRASIVVMSSLGAAIFAVLLALGVNAHQRARIDPTYSKRWDALRSQLRFRRPRP